MVEKRKKIPDNDDYIKTITILTEKKDLDTLITLRMGAEMGMTRLEIVNAKVSDLDRDNKRGLWIDIAKKVRRGSRKTKKGRKKPIFEMRKREVPINTSLYQLLTGYIERGQIYILKRKKGQANKPFTTRMINTLYDNAGIGWSSHKSRHYFKNRLTDWMRKERQMDPELIKDLMGHKKNQTESYGSLSWDYKLSIVDKVFQ